MNAITYTDVTTRAATIITRVVNALNELGHPTALVVIEGTAHFGLHDNISVVTQADARTYQRAVAAVSAAVILESEV